MSEQTGREGRSAKESKASYLLRLEAIPDRTVLGITWQNRTNARERAAELDAWLDGDPQVRRHIAWCADGTSKKYLMWAHEPGRRYNGGELIRAIADAAGVPLPPDGRSTTSFESTVYLLTPAHPPYVGRTIGEYADHLDCSDLDRTAGRGTGALRSYRTLCTTVETNERIGADRWVERTVVEVHRDPDAVAAVLGRCRDLCENPDCGGMPADVTGDGDPLLEVDHVEELARGGRDHPENMIALCPNCHAMKTRGSRADQLRETFRNLVRTVHAAALARSR